ncbi:MAG: hypothetical protein ABJC98_05175, partial [Bacteroidota bacterium]
MEGNKKQSPSLHQKKIIFQDKYPLSEFTGRIIGYAMKLRRPLKHLLSLFIFFIFHVELSQAKDFR